MKILYFGGGLGNQIFEYAFYLTIKDKFPKDSIYGVYDKKKFKEHAGGFEIERIFNVNFPKASLWANLVMFFILAWNRIVHRTSLYCHNLTTPNYNAVLFNANKFNKNFFEGRKEWISFKPIQLKEKNTLLIDIMSKENVVSLHVRRGDFLSAKYAANHVGIATEEYYQKAIELVKSNIANPRFVVFSDDIPWCRDNLNLNDAIFCDWNIGTDSYIDMYLMTFAKANIIANSTFSYWGACLNKHNPLVIYPEKWKTSEADNLDIFFEDWIAL